jgi:DNA/RNA-binding domain of Phe-tRNA-synthetase-like protein
MAALDLLLDAALLARFPSCRVGGFLVRKLGAAAGRLAGMDLDGARAALEAAGITAEGLSAEPRIREWRRAFSECGLKPSAFKSSPEQLASRLLKGKGISTPLPVVNAYCAVSVRHLAPMGAYDLARLPEPSVILRTARNGEDVFQPLGGRPEDMPLSERVAVYASGSEVICWAFNHRDSARTCLQEETDEALPELRALLASCGAQAGEIRFVDPAAPHAVLSL